MMNIEKLDNRDFHECHNDIEWEVYDILDRDLDGSGTNSVELRGYQDEGNGYHIYSAEGEHLYPYEDEPEVDPSTIEWMEFVERTNDG